MKTAEMGVQREPFISAPNFRIYRINQIFCPTLRPLVRKNVDSFPLMFWKTPNIFFPLVSL